MEVVYSYDLVQIGYDKANKMLRVSWQNYLTSEDFARGLRALLQLTRELGIEKWLIDARKSDELEPKNLRLPKDYFGSFVAQTSLNKVAHLIPQDPQYQNEMKELVQYLEKKHPWECEIRFFECESKALNWLREKDDVKLAKEPEIKS